MASTLRCGGLGSGGRLRLLVLPIGRVQTTGKLQTAAVARSFEKTPIQKWGWDYLVKQEGLKRPLSPHLTVYKPQLTMMVSGMARISGVVMGGVLLVGAMGVMVAPMDFTAMVEMVRGWGIPAPVTAALRFIIVLPLMFHTLNAIRFMCFNMAKGLGSIGQIYQSGYFVIALSLALSLVVTFWRADPKTVAASAKRR